MTNYSGKFVLRLNPEIHQKLSNIAKNKGISLNQLCVLILSGQHNTAQEWLIQQCQQEILPTILSHFDKNLIGILLFGSQVTGGATESSDIDLFIILDPKIAISRNLYSWWDLNIKYSGDITINPHFVAFPVDLLKVSGIWFEVAQNHAVIYQQGRKITVLLQKLSNLIKEDRVRKYWSNGHSYWIWRPATKPFAGKEEK